MMETVDPAVKKALVDLIFSVYENLPREACDALEAMGVLRPGLDRYSIERIAREYLRTFKSTLEGADVQWENQMSAEEKTRARKKRRAKIGADLFATQADRPFLFPPVRARVWTVVRFPRARGRRVEAHALARAHPPLPPPPAFQVWTFVFRALSTIDGIGKTLDRKYDFSVLSAPYLRELADLRDGSAAKSAVKELGRRLGLRPVDISQLVTQPRAVASLKSSVARIEEGETKLRVRALEVERVLERVELRQRMTGAALGAAALWQVARDATLGRLVRFPVAAAGAALALEAFKAFANLDKLKKQALRFSNEGDAKYDTADLTAS